MIWFQSCHVGIFHLRRNFYISSSLELTVTKKRKTNGLCSAAPCLWLEEKHQIIHHTQTWCIKRFIQIHKNRSMWGGNKHFKNRMKEKWNPLMAHTHIPDYPISNRCRLIHSICAIVSTLLMYLSMRGNIYTGGTRVFHWQSRLKGMLCVCVCAYVQFNTGAGTWGKGRDLCTMSWWIRTFLCSGDERSRGHNPPSP